VSGHSKWHNIARKKEKTDSQRAQIFTKLSREIIVAVREGGADPSSNSKLKDCIAKARAGNVPSDNIKRLIEKAAGAGSGENYERNTYEGYGPGGVAVIVETMTDNRNRTASEMRHYFDKCGGNLGAPNSVSWSFDPKGVLIVEREDRDEDEFMMLALDAGAEDFFAEDETFEVYTSPDDFTSVRESMEAAKIEFLSAQVEMVPQNYQRLNEDQAKSMRRLLDMLENNDDVQNVWHNWEE
jgi:YebC/PmpR family DNA-binding regulatory protein